MDSYTPITLPYFAPAGALPAPLPTHEEVLASTDILLYPTAIIGKTVARVGQHFIAKYGKDVKSIEGENMLFISRNTTIPVPKLYAMYTFGEDETMIIMEFVAGKTLADCLPSMSAIRIKDIKEKLEAQVNELRRIPAPGYYGALGRRPLTDFYWNQEFGPFDNVADFTKNYFDMKFSSGEGKPYDEIKRFCAARLKGVATALGHSHPVFSHGDLHDANIIVRYDDTPVIIDYELAGFYPAYHEAIALGLSDCCFNFLDEEFYEELNIILDSEDMWDRARGEEPVSEEEQRGLFRSHYFREIPEE
ncbi:kinase-like domain-containing protein [Nemania sp. FL0031]|nr:kinase-like domain-containing protein [Nemania sp. FL0031]